MQQLDEITNQTFIYKGNPLTIESWKKINQNIVIKTNKKTLNFFDYEIDAFLKELLPYTEIAAPKNQVPVMYQYQKSETHQKLETALKDMIDKVMENVEEIPKATALCNIGNTMINLEKQQINFLKATNQIG